MKRFNNQLYILKRKKINYIYKPVVTWLTELARSAAAA